MAVSQRKISEAQASLASARRFLDDFNPDDNNHALEDLLSAAFFIQDAQVVLGDDAVESVSNHLFKAKNLLKVRLMNAPKLDDRTPTIKARIGEGVRI